MWGDVRADGALLPAEQDSAVMCLAMVETQAGVDALEDIVRVPGIDGVYIGPNDLALGCGHGRSTYRDSVDVEHLIQHIIDTCRAAGVVAGLHCSDAEMAVHWAGRGARLLTVNHDTSLLRAAATQSWSTLESAAGVAARRRTGEDPRLGGPGLLKVPGGPLGDLLVADKRQSVGAREGEGLPPPRPLLPTARPLPFPTAAARAACRSPGLTVRVRSVPGGRPAGAPATSGTSARPQRSEGR